MPWLLGFCGLSDQIWRNRRHGRLLKKIYHGVFGKSIKLYSLGLYPLSSVWCCEECIQRFCLCIETVSNLALTNGSRVNRLWPATRSSIFWASLTSPPKTFWSYSRAYRITRTPKTGTSWDIKWARSWLSSRYSRLLRIYINYVLDTSPWDAVHDRSQTIGTRLFCNFWTQVMEPQGDQPRSKLNVPTVMPNIWRSSHVLQRVIIATTIISLCRDFGELRQICPQIRNQRKISGNALYGWSGHMRIFVAEFRLDPDFSLCVWVERGRRVWSGAKHSPTVTRSTNIHIYHFNPIWSETLRKFRVWGQIRSVNGERQMCLVWHQKWLLAHGENLQGISAYDICLGTSSWHVNSCGVLRMWHQAPRTWKHTSPVFWRAIFWSSTLTILFVLSNSSVRSLQALEQL